VQLSGTGIAPSASITPATYTFANQQVGTTSPVQTFTYTNTGPVAITVSSATLSGAAAADYKIASNSCTFGKALAPGAACKVGVTFTPSGTGGRAAALTVIDEAGGAPPQTSSLLGAGVAPQISLNPELYDYGTVKAATTATFTLTNSGTAPLAINGISMIVGAQFKVTGGTCAAGGVVGTGSSCTVTVKFIPPSSLDSEFPFIDLLIVQGTGVGVGAPPYAAYALMAGY
jgi:hypothetical protein